MDAPLRKSLKQYANVLSESLKEVDERIGTLLKELVKKKEGKSIKHLPHVFKENWLRKKGQIEVKIILAGAPTKEKITQLEFEFEQILQKKVLLTTLIDPTIVGGMRIEFKDYVIDGTVKKNLADLRTQLQKAYTSSISELIQLTP